jgi:hypothetical protein
MLQHLKELIFNIVVIKQKHGSELIFFSQFKLMQVICCVSRVLNVCMLKSKTKKKFITCILMLLELQEMWLKCL